MKEKKEKTNEKVNDLQKMLSKMGFSEEKENELYNKKNKVSERRRGGAEEDEKYIRATTKLIH